jgi:hypothetical protein
VHGVIYLTCMPLQEHDEGNAVQIACASFV